MKIGLLIGLVFTGINFKSNRITKSNLQFVFIGQYQLTSFKSVINPQKLKLQ